jgi:hypothetical protein
MIGIIQNADRFGNTNFRLFRRGGPRVFCGMAGLTAAVPFVFRYRRTSSLTSPFVLLLLGGALRLRHASLNIFDVDGACWYSMIFRVEETAALDAC